MFDDNLGLVYSAIRRFASPQSSDELQEIEQAALQALFKATLGFDPSRGFRFSTYAMRAITREIANARRKYHRFGPGQRLITPLDSVQEEFLVDPGPDPADAFDDNDQSKLVRKNLRRAIRSLSERDRFVIEMRFFAKPKLKLRDIGREIGVSQERVRQIERRALDRMRRFLDRRRSLTGKGVLGSPS